MRKGEQHISKDALRPNYKSPIDEINAKIEENIFNRYDNDDIFAAFLYGSRVIGNNKSHSDVDIMLISPQFELEPKKKIFRSDDIEFSIYEINKDFAERGIFKNKNFTINQFLSSPLYPIKNNEYISRLREKAIENILIPYRNFWEEDTKDLIKRIYKDTVLIRTTFAWPRYKEKTSKHADILEEEFRDAINELKEKNVENRKIRKYKNKLQRIYFTTKAARGIGLRRSAKEILKIEKRNLSHYI